MHNIILLLTLKIELGELLGKNSVFCKVSHFYFNVSTFFSIMSQICNELKKGILFIFNEHNQLFGKKTMNSLGKNSLGINLLKAFLHFSPFFF